MQVLNEGEPIVLSLAVERGEEVLIRVSRAQAEGEEGQKGKEVHGVSGNNNRSLGIHK